MARSQENAPIASLTGVSKSFNGVPILRDVSLDIQPGLTLFTGHSGSGKSSIIRAMGAIEGVDEGTVRLFGQDLARLSDRAKNKLMARRVGIGFQTPNLDGNYSVRENLLSHAEGLGTPGNLPRRSLQLADRFGFGHQLDRKVASLSGGEMARVALGRALMTSPELLLLDEPTDSIDPVGTPQVFAALHELRQEEGFSAVLITHDPDQARPFADYEVVIESGQVKQTIALAAGSLAVPALLAG